VVTAQTLADVSTIFGASGSSVLFTTAYVLILPYALVRWASGRDVVIAFFFILANWIFGDLVNGTAIGEILTSLVFLLFPGSVGAAVRYRTSSRLRAVDQARLREREQLARELHDTIAHHVSAIAIRAQAGRVVGASDPSAAKDALMVIEGEASRALTEMRMMIGTLREGDEPALAPQQGIPDIAGLARLSGPSLLVDVELSGELDDVGPSVGAAVYRLAQESITNAVRHARHATTVNVSVTGDRTDVHLVVADDGEASLHGPGSTGYGLVGMAERAALLGGSFEAGPSTGRGWTVSAWLPKVVTAR
jgi:signal transduction histidine kinase